jgi:hypothetical protein
MISGITLTPSFLTLQAAVRIARNCMRLIRERDAETATAVTEHGVELVQIGNLLFSRQRSHPWSWQAPQSAPACSADSCSGGSSKRMVTGSHSSP